MNACVFVTFPSQWQKTGDKLFARREDFWLDGLEVLARGFLVLCFKLLLWRKLEGAPCAYGAGKETVEGARLPTCPLVAPLQVSSFLLPDPTFDYQ